MPGTGIGVGTSCRPVRLVWRRHNPAVVTKARRRGSSQTIGIVTTSDCFCEQFGLGVS